MPTDIQAHYKDLSHQYATNMAYHGMGVGLFEPIAFEDMVPPCCGFFDQNNDWNRIADISTEPGPEGFGPLRETPRRVRDIDISWQPKTSLGVQAHKLDTSLQTPSNIPGGADAHIKYSTKDSFGAILMTTNPIMLVAYNEKRLFMQWFKENKALVYSKYGRELRRHSFWIVTRTHSAPRCSINVWTDNNKDTVVSLQAKASMLGELGESMNWKDQLYDKDWSHYGGKTANGVVVFMDGIQITPWHWWMEGFRLSMPWSLRPTPYRSIKNTRGYDGTPPVTQSQAPLKEDTENLQDDEYLDDQVLKDAGVYSQFSRSSRNSLYVPSRQSMQAPSLR